jgi:hypothetical protein
MSLPSTRLLLPCLLLLPIFGCSNGGSNTNSRGNAQTGAAGKPLADNDDGGAGGVGRAGDDGNSGDAGTAGATAGSGGDAGAAGATAGNGGYAGAAGGAGGDAGAGGATAGSGGAGGNPLPPGPDPSTVALRSVKAAGTGCPAGSGTGDLAADARSFHVHFPSFQALLEPTSPLTEARKNCQFLLAFTVPAGWSYAVTSESFTGSSQGQGAAELTTLFFAGQLHQRQFQAPLAPGGGTFAVMAPLPANEPADFSACGAPRALQVNLELRAGGTGSQVQLDGDATFGLTWLACPDASSR